jgi:hypothetical protein
MPRDPSFTGVYGPLKYGKTADLLGCFGDRAVYVAAPGALAPAEKLWGFPQPKAHDLETFSDIRRFASGNDVNGFVALVIDDASLIADRTVNYYKSKSISGYDLWGAVFTSAIRMRDTLRRRGLHVAVSCHAQPTDTKDGVRRPGGPAFPGQVAAKLPAAFDLLLRAEARDGLGPQSFGWPFTYRTGYHPDWLQGSRYSTPDFAPMNLGEILRLAGFAIPRMKGLEWQGALADALAAKLLEAPGLADAEHVKKAIGQVKDFALAKFTKSEAHAYWAVRDGYDRAILRAASAGQRRQLWGV